MASYFQGSSGMCNFCHQRPKYVEGSRVHDYCGRTCASNAAKAGGGGGYAGRGGPSNAGGSGGPVQTDLLCLMCLRANKQGKSHFCGRTCSSKADSQAPMLLEVPAGHATFKDVQHQFQVSWRNKGTACPPVRHIYKICSSAKSMAAYEAYKASVEARGHFVNAGRTPGNENRRWHGTRRNCLLGDKGNTSFCSSTGCALCNIIKTSYNLALSSSYGRFGKGLYTSSTSSKSDDYSYNATKSKLKAMMLNKVVVGRGHKLINDNSSLTAPPAGYDSVLAEVSATGSVNKDELIVYTNDAIRPSFLIMYEP